MNVKEIISLELKHENMINRVNAIHNLLNVVQVMPVLDVINDLFPVVNELIDPDHDEVFVAYAEVLSDFIPLLDKGDLHRLIPTMEHLTLCEDESMREALTKSMVSLSQALDGSSYQHFIDMFTRLIDSDEETKVIIGASLFNTVYECCSESYRDVVVQQYEKICRHSLTVVKIFVFEKLKNFIPLLTEEQAYVFIDIFQQLSRDDSDSVRLHSPAVGIELAKKLSEDEAVLVLSNLLGCCSDTSWRVKFMIASVFTELLSIYPRHLDKVMKCYYSLLNDSEVEVRVESTKHISEISQLLPIDTVITEIFPVVKSVGKDSTYFVRAELVDALPLFIEVVGKEAFLKNIDVLYLLMSDQNSHVKLNVVKNIEKVFHARF
eukprot:TRINITY_DN12741_c0_g1_i1.p1 TRINITY_DN12741_c0_g1~~TRINITY_DN12741_c0_g1_i1.p1  ORF type:complete len:378 (+),score=72.22 TRINITY_DN12741_c0_g1_i1:2-1135(+)